MSSDAISPEQRPEFQIAESAGTVSAAMETSGPVGIGGWLLLPMLHLVTSIGMTAWNLWQIQWDVLKLLFLPADFPVAGLRLPMTMSLLAGVVLVGWSILALIQIFRRSPRVPLTMTIFYVGALALTLLEMMAQSMINSSLGRAIPFNPMDIIRIVIAAAIWIPYFHQSKRVANTFKSRESKVNTQIDKIFS